MKKYNRNERNNQGENSNWSIIEEVLRKGAREMLQTAIETEVIDYIDKYRHIKNEKGYRVV